MLFRSTRQSGSKKIISGRGEYTIRRHGYSGKKSKEPAGSCWRAVSGAGNDKSGDRGGGHSAGSGSRPAYFETLIGAVAVEKHKKPGTAADKSKKEKLDYDETTYCKNKGKYADHTRCLTWKKNCIYYEEKKKQDGSLIGVCKKRRDARQRRKQSQKEDLKVTLEISTHTRKEGS